MAQQIEINAIEAALVSILSNDDTEGTGLAIDASGCAGLIFSVNYGISLDTLSGSLYHTLTFEKSVDSAFTTPVALVAAELYDADGIRSAATYVIDAAAEDPVVVNIGVILDADYRYYRIKNDVTGTHTNGTPLGAVAIKQYESYVT